MRPSRPRNRAVLQACVFAFGLLVFTTAARAQVVSSVTVESQYAIRGVVLDDGKPDLRLGLSYDHRSGAYGGLSGVVGETARDGVQPLAVTAYAGLARQTSQGLGWDVGFDSTRLEVFQAATAVAHPPTGAAYAYDYTRRYRTGYDELYGGLAFHDTSARIYFSHNYFSGSARTLYLDVTRTVRPTKRLSLYAHFGALSPLGGASIAAGVGRRERFDAGLGGVWSFRHAEVRLSLTGVSRRETYVSDIRQKPANVVLGFTQFF